MSSHKNSLIKTNIEVYTNIYVSHAGQQNSHSGNNDF